MSTQTELKNPGAEMPAQTASPQAGPKASTEPIRPISIATRVYLEIRKLLDFRAGKAVILTSLAIMVFFSILATAYAPQESNIADSSLAGAVALLFILPIFGVIIGVDEWRLKSVMVTYVQDPKRTAIFVSKCVAAVLIAWVLGAIGMLTGIAAGMAFGVNTDTFGLIPGMLPPEALGLALSILIGVGLGAATLSLGLGIVLYFVGAMILPQILSGVPVLADLVPYLGIQQPISELLSGTWLSTPVEGTVAVVLWTVLPLAIGLFRNATKDIS